LFSGTSFGFEEDMKKYVWDIITKKSSIHFKVKYLQISNISGYFARFKGEVITGEFFVNPEVSLIIETNSIETSDANWNKILKTDTSLAEQQHPYLSFNSRGGCNQSSGKIWELTGDLSVKHEKSQMTMVVSMSSIKKKSKNSVALFRLFGKVSRKSLGLSCMEEDVGDEVHVAAEIYLIRRPPGADDRVL
jgi:polyisoprenoid-binding protein YceI